MGFLFAFLSAVFSSSKDLISKKLAFNVSGTISAFASFLFALPYYFVLLLVLGLTGKETFHFSTGFLGLVILRSLTDTAAEWLKMHALTKGDISLIGPFLSLSTLFLLFTSPVITGDKIPALGFTAVALTICGTTILVFPSKVREEKLPWKGIALALCSAFCFSLNNCFDRLAVQHASPALSAFAMTLLAALFLLPFAIRQGKELAVLKVRAREFSLRGLFEILFMVIKLYALQYLQAPYVSAIQKSSVLLNIIGGRVMFGETETRRRLFAASLILFGVMLVIFAQLKG